MAGTLNALGLLAVIAVTIVVLLGYGRFPLRKELWPEILYGFVFGVLLNGYLAFFAIMDFEKLPVIQALIPSSCMIISYPAHKGWVRRATMIFFFISYLVLCTQFPRSCALTTTPAIPRRSIIM